MGQPTIAEACKYLENLLLILDDAYWEASNIENKDRIYSIVSLVRVEMSELSKLSIQDHGMPYEAITAEFKEVKAQLNNLRKIMDAVVLRTKTAVELDRIITNVEALTD